MPLLEIFPEFSSLPASLVTVWVAPLLTRITVVPAVTVLEYGEETKSTIFMPPGGTGLVVFLLHPKIKTTGSAAGEAGNRAELLIFPLSLNFNKTLFYEIKFPISVGK